MNHIIYCSGKTHAMKEKRRLYRGIFNWSGQVMTEYIRANSEDQAYRLLCARIAMTKGQTAYSVRQRFAGKASYTIQEVKENGKG